MKSIKKILLGAGMVASLASCDPKAPVTPVTPENPSKKYTEITQSGDKNIYKILTFATNDGSLGGVTLSDTSNINKFLKTGLYNILGKDYNLGPVGLYQFMSPDSYQKIVGGQEISDADLGKYFVIDGNGKINLNTYKTNEFAKDVVNYIENIYIPNKIKNKEQFVGNNYAIQLLVPRKYYAGGVSGMQRNFSYTDAAGDTKIGYIAISYVGNQYFKEGNPNWIAGAFLDYINIGNTHEPMHYHTRKAAQSLQINLATTAGLDASGHVQQIYNRIGKPGHHGFSRGQFGPGSGGGDPSIFPMKGSMVILNDQFNYNTGTFDPQVVAADKVFVPEGGVDTNPYNPDSNLGQTVGGHIQSFMQGQNTFTKKIPNTSNARIGADHDYNIKTELVHTDH